MVYYIAFIRKKRGRSYLPTLNAVYHMLRKSVKTRFQKETTEPGVRAWREMECDLNKW